jgi:hypothetical protein
MVRVGVFRCIEVQCNRSRLRKHPELGYVTHSKPEIAFSATSPLQCEQPLSMVTGQLRMAGGARR